MASVYPWKHQRISNSSGFLPFFSSFFPTYNSVIYLCKQLILGSPKIKANFIWLLTSCALSTKLQTLGNVSTSIPLFENTVPEINSKYQVSHNSCLLNETFALGAAHLF